MRLKHVSMTLLLLVAWTSNLESNERLLPRLQVVTEEWPPYNYTDQKGLVVGRATSQVLRLLNAANIDFDLNSYPWSRAMQQAKNNPNTMIYSIFQTAERFNDFIWLCPLIESPKMHLFRLQTRADLALASIEQLAGQSVAVVNGDFADQFFKQHQRTVDVHIDNSSLGHINFRKLIAGRVDFMVSTEFTMLEHVKSNDLNQHHVVAQIPITAAVKEPLCMAFNKQTDPLIIAKISEVMGRRSLK